MLNVLFVTFSHRVKLLSRMIPNQWVMFGLKGGVLGCSFLFYGALEEKAIQAHF